jgi:hypothetical protein
LRSRASIVAVAFLVSACIGFTDSGHSFVADNGSSTEIIARMTVTTFRSGVGTEQRAVIIPAKTRLVFAVQPFAGDSVGVVEFLDPACRSLGTFHRYDGALFVIADSLAITQRHEFPQGEATAVATDSCRLAPAPSPARS